MYKHFLLCAFAISTSAFAQLLLPSQAPAPPVRTELNAYGDTASYVAAATTGINRNDSGALLQAGDMLFQVSITEATKLHEAAAKLAPRDWQIQMELGYDYTALDDCKAATKSWDQVAKANQLTNGFAAVAAYCYLKVGRIDDAINNWMAAGYLSNHTGIERAIHGALGAPFAHARSAQGLERYRAQGWKLSADWVLNAFQWNHDWWNMSQNDAAIAVIAAELTAHKDQPAQRELQCLKDIVAAHADARASIARKCKLFVSGGKLPINSGVAYLLAVAMENDLNIKLLLRQFGPELNKRARSSEGDLQALRLLGYLQSRATDTVGLAASDELGAVRYKQGNFEASRLAGLGVLYAKAPTEQQRRMLAASAKSFPDQSIIQMHYMIQSNPKGGAYVSQLANLILAEYHQFNFSSVVSANPNARGLHEFFIRLAAARKNGASASLQDKL